MPRFNIKSHLNGLAIDLLKKATKKRDWEYHNTLESMEAHLLELRKALLGGNFWVRVDSVSRSGMSRKLTICYGKEPILLWDDAVLDIMSISPNLSNQDWRSLAPKDAVLDTMLISPKGQIDGCGMDMCFAAQYSLFGTLCPDKRYQDKMPRYRDLPW